MIRIIAGIDEVGRGAIAGPMAIGLAIGINNKETSKLLFGIKDSKKLSPKKRKEWFEKIKESGLIEFRISYISNTVIDKKGLSWSISEGVKRVLKKTNQKIDFVFLDGGLKAPTKYKQKTIIKGDEKIPIISAASIFAKLRRDDLMRKKEKLFPQYDWSKNKGYGTKSHYQAIKAKGFSNLHRKSFL